MLNKIIYSKQEMLNKELDNLIAVLESIIISMDAALPLCKKHSAIRAAHEEFDYKLFFLKNSYTKDTLSAEVIKVFDNINLYLINIIMKRLYDIDAKERLKEDLNNIKNFLKNA